MGGGLGPPVAAQGPHRGLPRGAPRVHHLHPLHAALLREVLRDADRKGLRTPVEAAVQNRRAVYAGAHIYNRIRDQHDRDLGEGDGEAPEPNISQDSNPEDGIL